MSKLRFRQRINALILPLVIAAAVFQFGGCGGSGDMMLAGGGIGGTGVTVSSFGTVTDFGSVIVNGIVYDTAAAEVFIENISKGSGDQAVFENLSTGMVVRVEGRITGNGSASADRIFFSSNLKGPVESISALDFYTKRAVILGQTVLMDDRTVLRNVAASSVAVGMVLEISGYHDNAGGMFASYINKVALLPDEPLEIKGVIGNLLPSSKTFDISGLTVDYSTAVFTGLPGNEPETGQLLKVRGRLAAANLLAAEFIALEDEFGSGVFDVVDFEGIITQAEEAGEFRIGRYSVIVGPETSYKNLSLQDLGQGMRVIVHGALTDRVILAAEISVPETIRIESNVSVIDAAGKSFVPAGFESTTILATAMTRINGIAQAFDGILPGHHIRVLGRRNAGGDILASTILVNPPSNLVEIAGAVESFSEPFVVVVGIEVDTSFVPADGFKDVKGRKVSAAEFFEALKLGDHAAVKGVLQAGSVSWTDIGIEN